MSPSSQSQIGNSQFRPSSGGNSLSEEQKKIDALNKLSYEERHHNPARSVEIANEALQLAEACGYEKGQATALSNLGFSDIQLTRHEQALEKIVRAVHVFEIIREEEGRSNALYNLGVVNTRLGNFDAAIEAFHECLSYREKTEDLPGQAACFFQLSFINETFGDLDTALELSKRCLAIREKLEDRLGRAAVLMQIGAISIKKKDFVNAKIVLEESLAIRKPEDEVRGYFATLLRWTELHIELGEYEKAKAFAKEGLEISTDAQEFYGVMRFLQTSGKLFFMQNEIEESLRYYHEAEKLAFNLNFKSVLYEIHLSLSEVYKSAGNFEKAFSHFENFHRLKEEVLTGQSNLRLKSVQLMNQIDSARREAELERTKNDELQTAYSIIEGKNKDILDSIHYAKRIQQSLLPTESFIEKNLARLKK
jgi:tetratricopeptide (TPR) repeat protein